MKLSEQKQNETKTNLGDFENFIPQLIQIVRAKHPIKLNQEETNLTKQPRHKHDSLLILANLAIRAQLRGIIAANDGIQLFLDVLKGHVGGELSRSVEGERHAAKGLLNMALIKQDTRHMIIANLTDELQMAFNG